MGQHEGETTGSSRAHGKRPTFATINGISILLFLKDRAYFARFFLLGLINFIDNEVNVVDIRLEDAYTKSIVACKTIIYV